jgi:outer membrane protein TolC
MNTLMRIASLFPAALLFVAADASAQQGTAPGRQLVTRALSLEQAIDLAIEGNTDLAIAEARRDMAGTQGRKAAGPLWPRLDLSAGYTRSVDPVFVFGTKLRQGTFGPSDLDFAELNNPDAIGDWSTVVGLRWSLLDPTIWAGRSSARSQADAASWSAVRMRDGTVLATRVLYYVAQAAAAQLEAADATVEAAEATYDAFRRRRERGLLTEADLLQAEAELAAARAQQVETERIDFEAAQELGLHLGWGPDTLPRPTDPLLSPQAPAEYEFDPSARSDLRALAAAADAADAAKTQASLNYIPAIDAFGQYATHSSDPLSFDRNNWTVGVMLRWTVFDGFGRSAEVQRANLQRHIARVEYEQAVRDARAELDQAERAVRSAERQVEATRTAAEAADTGRRLMRRRFDEGLATAADLMQAEARATAMRQRAISALARYHMAVARLDFIRSQSTSESQT